MSLKKNIAAYFILKYQSDIKSVKEIQNILNQEEVIIEYLVGKKTIFMAIVSKEFFEIKAIDIPENFEELVSNFYSSIQKAETKNFIKNSNKISEILIQPVYAEISHYKKLIIIPHDILFKLPFEALFTKKQLVTIKQQSELDFMIKHFNISYNYSANFYL